MASNELLKRIDERNYLTEREHREFLDRLNKDLEILEAIKNKAQNNRFFKGCLLRMFVDIEYDGTCFRTKKKIKDEDYDKIMRWLNEK